MKTPSPALPMKTSDAHICDVLIAERAPRLTRSPAWPVLKPLLYGLLNYKSACKMADAVSELSGSATLDHLSALLGLHVSVDHADRIPQSGRCIIICNHPTGIADGIAMYDAVRRHRADAIFFANADALRVSPRLDEIVIPVEWVLHKRTREKTRKTLDAARMAFEAERCVVMFPAGRLARVEKGRLTDPEWATTAASMARKYNAVIIPVHMTGPTSTLFHLFDRVSQELRDITLFHELLNKTSKPFHLIVGQPISPESLASDAASATAALKDFVERTLPQHPDAEFR